MLIELKARSSMRGMYEKESGVLAEYLDYLYLIKGFTRNSAYNYYMILRHFAKYLAHERATLDCEVEAVELPPVTIDFMNAVSKKEFLNYLDYCQYDRQERHGYINTRISAIRGFYRWLNDGRAKTFIENAVRLEEHEREPILVTRAMEQKLYDFFDEKQSSELARRNTCIIYLMLHFPITLNDILMLDMSDVNINTLRIRSGSDNEDEFRTIRLDEEAKAYIDMYIELRPQPRADGNPFFVSNSKRGRMKRSTVEKFLRKAAQRALPAQYITLRDIQATAIRSQLSKRTLVEVCEDSRINTRKYFRRAYGGYAVLGE